MAKVFTARRVPSAPLRGAGGYSVRSLLLAIILISLPVILVLAIAGSVSFVNDELPTAVGGYLDLRSWEFPARGPAELKGEWLFVPGRLLSSSEANAMISGWTPRVVPDLWKGNDADGISGRGVGTYRLIVFLPEGLDHPALRFTTASTAMEIEANGALVASVGHPSYSASESRAAYDPAVVPLPEGTSINLVIRVSNHEYRSGGLWRPLFIGSYDTLLRTKRFRDIYSTALFGAIAAIALHSFLQYVLRRAERTYLYFGFFAFFIALRALVTGEYVLTAIVPSLPFQVLIRIEYATAFLPIPFTILYLRRFFDAHLSKPILISLVLPSFFCAFFVPWAPLPFLTRFARPYSLLALATMFLASIVFIPIALRSKIAGRFLVLSGCAFILAAGINDMLFASFTARTGNLLPWSLAVFIVVQDIVLADNFSKEFVKATTLAEERSRHVKEMHHRVKNSLQLVSSILALQSNRSKDESFVEALRTTRDRIRSVSLVYEHLYSSEREGVMDLGEYLRALTVQLSKGYMRASLDRESLSSIMVDVPKVEMPIDVCVDCGLVATELIVNAYTHAAGSDGVVAISLSASVAEDKLTLVIADDGPGFPAGFQQETAGGLGFRVVTSIARRRRGSITLESHGGARVAVVLPIAESNR